VARIASDSVSSIAVHDVKRLLTSVDGMNFIVANFTVAL